MQNPVAFVIEDQVNISMLYEDALRLVGYEVVAIRDGLLALNALETQEAPSLIILDINLPRLSGRDLHKHIRSREKYSQVPVIILTANSLMAERLAPDMTARDHLFVKPIGMKEFQELAKAMRPGRDGVPDYMADTQRVPHLILEEAKRMVEQAKEEAAKILTPDDSIQTKPPAPEQKLSTQEHKAIITPTDEMIAIDDNDEITLEKKEEPEIRAETEKKNKPESPTEAEKKDSEGK